MTNCYEVRDRFRKALKESPDAVRKLNDEYYGHKDGMVIISGFSMAMSELFAELMENLNNEQ